MAQKKKKESNSPKPKAKEKSKQDSLKNHLYAITIISLILGVIIGFLVAGTTVKTSPSLIRTSCDINMQTLYEKPCEVTEDCYGRLELCSRSLHKCVTTVQVDKTDIRNIRIPDTKEECEANSGVWKVEIIPEE